MKQCGLLPRQTYKGIYKFPYAVQGRQNPYFPSSFKSFNRAPRDSLDNKIPCQRFQRTIIRFKREIT